MMAVSNIKEISGRKKNSKLHHTLGTGNMYAGFWAYGMESVNQIGIILHVVE
jgi:hypothetical protein